tara:strand:+ start:328 stop:1047 length:720 start_codon:yes stop_codon:yes gene_type:complete
MNIFAIGDIHGCLKQLISLQNRIFKDENFNKEKDILLYLGDYIDRGLQSKDVIDHLIKLKKDGIKSIFLMGNHEQVMSDFLFNKINNLRYWLNLGADKTLKSYDIEVAEFIKEGFEEENIEKLRDIFLKKLNQDHIIFFKNLKLNYTLGNYFFVHAGINPKKKMEEQTKEDFLWSRSKEFYDKNFQYNKIIVHGHTPEKNIINYPYRINVDTGCFFSGKLSCVCLNDTNKDRNLITLND